MWIKIHIFRTKQIILLQLKFVAWIKIAIKSQYLITLQDFLKACNQEVSLGFFRKRIHNCQVE